MLGGMRLFVRGGNNYCVGVSSEEVVGKVFSGGFMEGSWCFLEILFCFVGLVIFKFVLNFWFVVRNCVFIFFGSLFIIISV